MAKKEKKSHSPLYRQSKMLQLGALLLIAYVIYSDYQAKHEDRKTETKIVTPKVVDCEIAEGQKKKEEKVDNENLPHITNIKTGQGKAALCGDKVTIHYTGLLPDETIFKDTYASQEPLSFILGDEAVIAGLSRGVEGMKEGGIRQLIVPPAIAYRHSPPTNIYVPAEEQVGFKVELLKIEPQFSQSADIIPLKWFTEKEGSGKTAFCGDRVSISYVVFDATGHLIGKQEEKADITLGKDDVPLAFSAAINGMKEGGRLLLVAAPPHLMAKSPLPVVNLSDMGVLHIQISLKTVE